MNVIRLPAGLEGDKASALLPQLRQQMERISSEGVSIDAEGVERFDSATLALLLECRRIAQAHALPFKVQGLPSGLRSMAHVYGVDALLGLDAGTQGHDNELA